MQQSGCPKQDVPLTLTPPPSTPFPRAAYFMHLLSQALFELDQADVSELKARLARAGMEAGQLDGLSFAFLRKRCRVHVPRPQVLRAKLQDVLEKVKLMVDEDGVPLVSTATEDAFQRLLQQVDRDELSGEAKAGWGGWVLEGLLLPPCL